MGRPGHRADIGEPLNAPVFDVLRDNAARAGCLALLGAQLRAGAHILPLPLARRLGGSIGVHRDEVRASTERNPMTKGPTV